MTIPESIRLDTLWRSMRNVVVDGAVNTLAFPVVATMDALSLWRERPSWSRYGSRLGTLAIARNPLVRQGMMIGHAQVGRHVIVFAELPGEPRTHTVVGADEDGLSIAVPYADGPLVPGRPLASRREVLARLSQLASGPRPDRLSAREIVPIVDIKERSASSLRLRAKRAMRQAGDKEGREVHLACEVVKERLWDKLGQTRRLTFQADWDARTAVSRPSTRPSEMDAKADALSNDAARTRALRDFLKARPWLFTLAITTPNLDYRLKVEEAERALCSARGIPPAAMRRLGPEVGDVTPNVEGLISSVPIDWIPDRSDVEEWAAFRAVAEIMGKVPRGSDPRTLLAPAKGRWAPFAERIDILSGNRGGRPLLEAWRHVIRNEGDPLARSPAPPWKEQGIVFVSRFPADHHAQDTQDIVREFRNVLFRCAPIGADPDLLQGATRSLAVEAIVGTRGLPSLIETTRKWHQDTAMHDDPTSWEIVTWEPILPEWTDTETGISIVPLANSHELGFEGYDGMDPDGIPGLAHCVGGTHYVAGSGRNQIRIVSLRQDGRRLSTAQIDFVRPRERESLFPNVGDSGKRGALTGKVKQHRGLRNVQASPIERKALATYMALPEVREAISEAEIREFALPKKKIGEPLEVSIEKWRPYLTGKWKTAGVENLAKAMAEAIAGASEARTVDRPTPR